MPTYYKFSAVFKYVSGPVAGGGLNLAGGWTESVYWTSNSTAAVNSFRTLCVWRAALLPQKSAIVGIRLQQVNPRGAAQTFPANFPGGQITNYTLQDIPQMALLLRVRGAAVSNVRSMRLAALPDSVVVDGEYTLGDALWQAAMNNYLASLSGWLFQGRDLTIRPVNLASIDANGNYVAQANVTVVQGQTVRVSGAVDSKGVLHNGTFRIASTSDFTHGVLNGWTFGACTLGTITPYVAIYPAIIADATSISRVVVRKIGRPTLGYRGRRSTKRQKVRTVIVVQ